MDVFTDIPYVESSPHGHLHQFDLYVPSGAKSPAPLVCFVHGGAWRSEDKSKHAELARRLADETSLPVAVPNYRLTTPESKLHHPAHAEDLLAFLHFILSWPGPDAAGAEARPYDPSRLYVLVHSCSAHMLTSILLAPPSPTPSLVPSAALLSSVRGVIMSEGIYDIDRLLVSFPTYKEWFIASTFGDAESYGAFNTTAYELRKGGERIRWLVLHSTGDTLVDVVQSQSMIARLQSFHPDTSGSQDLIESCLVMTQEHNDVLLEDKYHEVVSSFIARTEDINSKSVA